MDDITKTLGLKPGESPEDLLRELDLAPEPCSLGKPDDGSLVTDLLVEAPLLRQPPLHMAYARDLREADIAAPRTTHEPRTLVRIHASHHALARCLATGMKPAQAALVTGYSPGRISALSNDPTFKALVVDYQNEIKGAYADLAERMAAVSLDAIEILHEKIHDSPGELTVSILLDIIKTFADRTGHGPGQEVTIRQSADLIDRPPRESFDEWRRRRTAELEEPTPVPRLELKKLN